MNTEQITSQRLHELFIYEDGKLFRKSNNKRAGGNTTIGYRSVSIDGTRYYEHRLIYLMEYGNLPKEIDHINGMRNDNRIENLRPTSRSQNNRNRKITTGNSRWRGVHFATQNMKWGAYCMVYGKRKHIGYFEDERDAATAVNLYLYNNLSDEDLEFVHFNISEEKMI